MFGAFAFYLGVYQLVDYPPWKREDAGSSPATQTRGSSRKVKRGVKSPPRVILPLRLTAGHSPLKGFIEVRILEG